MRVDCRRAMVGIRSSSEPATVVQEKSYDGSDLADIADSETTLKVELMGFPDRFGHEV